MFDASLRGLKDRVLAPLVGVFAPVHPTALTAVGLALGLGCAGAAAAGHPLVALGLWLANRVFDGLDGLVARRFGRSSDLGGYLDLVADFVVYAAVPLGLAWAAADPGVWIAAAVLLATYYVNAVSWLALSALEEKRRTGAADRATTLAMPRGLVEGFETVVLYAAFFLWVDALAWLFGLGALLVALSAAARVAWAVKTGLR